MNIKKRLISAGAIVGTATPIIGVVSCTSINDKELGYYPLLPTYTGQADQLLALGITPDYYPLQLDATKPYEYLFNPKKFMYDSNSEFANKFEQKILSMMSKVKTYGQSWWNQQALSSGEKGSDPSYWQRQKGDVVLYEHYLLDDDEKVIDSAVAPTHDESRAIETNFRWSRDPYTRLSKGVIFGLDLTDIKYEGGKLTIEWIGGAKPSAQDITINGQTCHVSEDDLNVIQSLINDNVDQQGKGSWVYNTKFFAAMYHMKFLDNEQFNSTSFKNWIVDTTVGNKPAFDFNKSTNEALMRLFSASTYNDEEKQAGIKLPKLEPGQEYIQVAQAHHPIYEQQEGEVGAAPMFEGSMRDNMLYLYNVSSQVANLANFGKAFGNDQNKDQANIDFIKSHLRNDQFVGMQNALTNADKISNDLQTRMQEMKKYFVSLGAVNETNPAQSKTFAIMTIAPGHGMSTIQSMSKYSFLYRELGFNQPIPSNLNDIAGNDELAQMHANESGALFNMDDNGWWWNLGEETGTITRNLMKFKNQADIGVITARQSDFKNTVDNQVSVKSAVNSFFKNTNVNDLNKLIVDYDLWNEGIKTPFVFHMVLDEVVKYVEQWYKQQSGVDMSKLSSSLATSAKQWGNYFENQFLN